jgi:ATP-dependent Clp protease ATP-binding subunit ClpA
MFERFTRPARQVVTDAIGEAERAQARRVGTEHVLLALLGKETRSAAVLAEAGVTREALLEAFEAIRRRGGLTDAEAAALRSLGIDVDNVVEQVEREHGAGALAEPRSAKLSHIPFTDEAKELLVGTLRQAQGRGDRRIGDEHLLLALAAADGSAAQVLAGHGLTYPEVRARLAKAA